MTSFKDVSMLIFIKLYCICASVLGQTCSARGRGGVTAGTIRVQPQGDHPQHLFQGLRRPHPPHVLQGHQAVTLSCFTLIRSSFNHFQIFSYIPLLKPLHLSQVLFLLKTLISLSQAASIFHINVLSLPFARYSSLAICISSLSCHFCLHLISFCITEKIICPICYLSFRLYAAKALEGYLMHQYASNNKRYGSSTTFWYDCIDDFLLLLWIWRIRYITVNSQPSVCQRISYPPPFRSLTSYHLVSPSFPTKLLNKDLLTAM